MIFRVFKKEEGVDVQTVFVFKKTRRRLDVFQFRSGGRVLAQFRLHAGTFFIVRLDQINPNRAGEVFDFVSLKAG